MATHVLGPFYRLLLLFPFPYHLVMQLGCWHKAVCTFWPKELWTKETSFLYEVLNISYFVIATQMDHVDCEVDTGRLSPTARKADTFHQGNQQNIS